MGMLLTEDYIDQDVSYLLGLIIARGVIYESPSRKIIIDFPYKALEVEGLEKTFDQKQAIQLGLMNIQNRLKDLLSTEMDVFHGSESEQLVISFSRPNMIWRNLNLILDNKTDFAHFEIPDLFFNKNVPKDYKIEFVRGLADVAGNIRHSNRYTDGRRRVRLDILNYKTNWHFPIQLCALLQDQIGVPVQLITWGHPNLGRDFKEHQLNIFAAEFLKIGFSFPHKQKLLEKFAEEDLENIGIKPLKFCPGQRSVKKRKPKNVEEANTEKLDDKLAGKHFDAYWQICRKMGCQKRPVKKQKQHDSA